MPSDSPYFPRVGLIGVGLMGGSLGLALRERRLAGRVVGAARRAETRESALALGLVDDATDDVREAVEGADLIVLGSPLLTYEAILKTAAPGLKAGSVVTDLGSSKAQVVPLCEAILAPTGARFVGGHPMAGSEESGPAAARADLYEKAVWCITPTSKTDEDATRQVRGLAEAVGASTLLLSPEEHDLAVAASSHAPHLVAAALVSGLASIAEEIPAAAQLTAGGFRDSTRIASGSPEMWRDICLTNAEGIVKAIDAFRRALDGLEAVIREGDGDEIEARLRSAKKTREKILNRALDS